MTTLERILAKLRKMPNGCWEFMGYRNKWGYGCIGVHGGSMLAHRVLYDLMIDEVPTDMCVLHTCDNPACCNPEHLFLGTHLDNSNDKINKGRMNSRKGIDNSRAKLNGDKVKEIKSLIAQGHTDKELSTIYEVSPSTIWQIRKGNNWKEIE